MDISVEFETSLFRPYLPEDCQVNPGCYGAELAYWLSQKLATHKVYTSYPEYEDWGWIIEYVKDTGEEFWLCCANIDESTDKWSCRLVAKGKGFFGRKTPEMALAKPLIEALRRVLEDEAAIAHIQWEPPFSAI